MKNYSRGKNLKVVLVEAQLDCEKSDHINDSYLPPQAWTDMCSVSKHILFSKCHMIPTCFANGEQSPCLSQKKHKLEKVQMIYL